MNKKKWRDPKIPIEMLGLKLAEEAGEVAREITDGYFDAVSYMDREHRASLLEELNHVLFIAEELHRRVNNWESA